MKGKNRPDNTQLTLVSLWFATICDLTEAFHSINITCVSSKVCSAVC